jgi:hypothetical protein
MPKESPGHIIARLNGIIHNQREQIRHLNFRLKNESKTGVLLDDMQRLFEQHGALLISTVEEGKHGGILMEVVFKPSPELLEEIHSERGATSAESQGA